MAAMLSASCATLPMPKATAEDLDQLDHLRYSAPGQEVGALRAGSPEGLRVLYVHGSPGKAEDWLRFLLDPIPGTDSIAIDRPGYRSSDEGPVPALVDQAAAIVPLLEARNGRWPILVGHSLGGPIIAQVAALHPDRVGSLVIVAGSLDPELERRRWFNYAAKGLSWILPAMLRRSNQEIWDLKPELEALASQLGTIRCPVTIVHGKRDRLVPYANVAFMQRSLTGARSVELISMEEANHFLLWKEPYESELRRAIQRLVEGPAD